MTGGATKIARNLCFCRPMTGRTAGARTCWQQFLPGQMACTTVQTFRLLLHQSAQTSKDSRLARCTLAKIMKVDTCLIMTLEWHHGNVTNSKVTVKKWRLFATSFRKTSLPLLMSALLELLVSRSMGKSGSKGTLSSFAPLVRALLIVVGTV